MWERKPPQPTYALAIPRRYVFCPFWQLVAMPFLTQASAWHLSAKAASMGARTRNGGA